MDFNEITRNIKNKVYHKIYFLAGEEPYFIDEITSMLENTVLDETAKSFNQTIIYGNDVNEKQIIDTCRAYPLIPDNYQLIIVKEAQNLKSPDDLIPYFNNPLETTILVIAYKHKKVDKRKIFYKTLNKAKNAAVFLSDKLRDYQIPKWIESELTKRGYSTSPMALMLMSEYLGTNLGTIINEINKLTISLKPGTKITEVEIENNIGISKDFNIFELERAMTNRDYLAAYRIIDYFESNPKDHPHIFNTSMLHNYFVKVIRYHYLRNQNKNVIASELGVSPYFIDDYKKAAATFPLQKIKEIISLILDMDLKCKGIGTNDGTSYGYLREFVYKALN